MIDKWKLILREATDCCNRCSTSFQEMQNKVDEAINIIKAADEYNLFTERYKTNPPEPVNFRQVPIYLIKIHSENFANTFHIKCNYKKVHIVQHVFF